MHRGALEEALKTRMSARYCVMLNGPSPLCAEVIIISQGEVDDRVMDNEVSGIGLLGHFLCQETRVQSPCNIQSHESPNGAGNQWPRERRKPETHQFLLTPRKRLGWLWSC